MVEINFTLINFRGENILLFLVQTVGRQLVEQRQYRPARTRAPGTRNKTLAQELGIQLIDNKFYFFGKNWIKAQRMWVIKAHF